MRCKRVPPRPAINSCAFNSDSGATDGTPDVEPDVDPDEPLLARGDSSRLFQLLQNLVDNALRFTPSGGHITVRVGAAADPAYVRLDVEDSGVGVPADAKERLFDPFFQVPRSAHVGQGSGLGLAIVKAVVDAHRGFVEVDSQEGEGTTFRVSLPRVASRRDPAPTLLPMAADAPEAEPSLVDDDDVRVSGDAGLGG